MMKYNRCKSPIVNTAANTPYVKHTKLKNADDTTLEFPKLAPPLFSLNWNTIGC